MAIGLPFLQILVGLSEQLSFVDQLAVDQLQLIVDARQRCIVLAYFGDQFLALLGGRQALGLLVAQRIASLELFVEFGQDSSGFRTGLFVNRRGDYNVCS